jgi:uncharacterized protein YecT (DUF1311 family)
MNAPSLMAVAVLLVLATGPAAMAQTQGDMDAAESARAARLDKQLNAAYQQLMSRYSAADQALLKQSERSWLKYRDDDCRYEAAGVTGGSAYPMVYAMCLQGLTAERLKRLQYQAGCQEGDLSCVEPKPN